MPRASIRAGMGAGTAQRQIRGDQYILIELYAIKTTLLQLQIDVANDTSLASECYASCFFIGPRRDLASTAAKKY
jgi:hypothetical protein